MHNLTLSVVEITCKLLQLAGTDKPKQSSEVGTWNFW